MATEGFENITVGQAQTLVSQGAVTAVDVRTPGEFRDIGRIPGAKLVPMQILAAGLATLPRDRPLLVYCEHGIRSQQASDFFVRCGFETVYNMLGGLSCWTAERQHGAIGAQENAGPSPWLMEAADLLPNTGRVLDVACGAGRHALVFAGVGFETVAIDIDEHRIAALRDIAERTGFPLDARVADLEANPESIDADAFEVVTVVHYLHRPLFPRLIEALRPGGLLLYETFTVAQAKIGKPTNPDFLLKPGELKTLVAPLEILREREGESEGRMVAAVAARKPR